MCAIVGPFAARLDKLAGGDHRGMADDSNRITLAARLYAQHAETIVFIMKCYPLNEAGEDFRPWVRVYRHRVSDALLREARQDQNTRPASLEAALEVSGKPMPKEGTPRKCQLQAPNRVTGATVLSSATTFQRAWSNSQYLWRNHKIFCSRQRISHSRANGPKKVRCG